jgi:hypothetical protein
MSIVTLAVKSEGVPLPQVTVTVLDSDGDVEATTQTDVNGTALFDLIAGSDYFITANHPNNFISAYKINGLELGIYDLVAVPKTLKVSADPDFCLVQGVFTDLSNYRLESWTFTVSAAEGYGGTHQSIFYGDLEVTAKDGYVEFPLVGGTSYIFKNLPFCDSKVVYVPPTRAASLSDLLLPVIVNLGGVPLAVAMDLNSITTIQIVPTLSNTLSGDEVESGLIGVEVSEDSALSVTLSRTYGLTLTSKGVQGNFTVNLVPTVDPTNGIYARTPKAIYQSITVSIG